jgi:hypothetical protein
LAEAAGSLDAQAPHSDDNGITAPADLMKKHGVLNRYLLISRRAFAGYRPVNSPRRRRFIFPALRTILSPKQVEALGERMEEDEHKVPGDEGFENSGAADRERTGNLRPQPIHPKDLRDQRHSVAFRQPSLQTLVDPLHIRGIKRQRPK